MRGAPQRLVSQAADVLKNRTIEKIFVSKEDVSLWIIFSGDLQICTVPSEDDPEHEQWMLRGSGGSPEVAGCEEGIYPVERDSEGRRV